MKGRKRIQKIKKKIKLRQQHQEPNRKKELNELNKELKESNKPEESYQCQKIQKTVVERRGQEYNILPCKCKQQEKVEPIFIHSRENPGPNATLKQRLKRRSVNISTRSSQPQILEILMRYYKTYLKLSPFSDELNVQTCHRVRRSKKALISMHLNKDPDLHVAFIFLEVLECDES